jgi:RNA polymerase sigma factor (sigma-70 family)
MPTFRRFAGNQMPSGSSRIKFGAFSPPMSLAGGIAPVWPSTGYSDEMLIEGCLEGRVEAWSGLIEKYKRLIFSVPVKVGLSHEDASDIFQSVCAKLARELPKLRSTRALSQWLIQVATHESFCAINNRSHSSCPNTERPIGGSDAHDDKHPDEIIRQTEREQLLREAIANLQARCQRLIFMLFFEEPVRSYEQIAKELGLAEGSLGIIRGRCLERLREQLPNSWSP